MPYTGTTVHWSSTYIADIIGDQTIQLPWCTIQTREQKDKKILLAHGSRSSQLEHMEVGPSWPF